MTIGAMTCKSSVESRSITDPVIKPTLPQITPKMRMMNMTVICSKTIVTIHLTTNIIQVYSDLIAWQYITNYSYTHEYRDQNK